MIKVLDVREPHAQFILSRAKNWQRGGDGSPICESTILEDVSSSLDRWCIRGQPLSELGFKAVSVEDTEPVGGKLNADILPRDRGDASASQFLQALWTAHPGCADGLSEAQKRRAVEIIQCVLAQNLLHSGVVRFIDELLSPVLLGAATQDGDKSCSKHEGVFHFCNFAFNETARDGSTTTLSFLVEFFYERKLPNSDVFVASVDTSYTVEFELPVELDSSAGAGWVAKFTVLHSKLRYADEYSDKYSSDIFAGDRQPQAQGNGVVFEFLRFLRRIWEWLFQSKDSLMDASVKDNFDDSLRLISNTGQSIDRVMSEQEFDAKKELDQRARTKQEEEGVAAEAPLVECAESTLSDRSDLYEIQETIQGRAWSGGGSGLCDASVPADGGASVLATKLPPEEISQGAQANPNPIPSPAVTRCPTAALFSLSHPQRLAVTKRPTALPPSYPQCPAATRRPAAFFPQRHPQPIPFRAEEAESGRRYEAAALLSLYRRFGSDL